MAKKYFTKKDIAKMKRNTYYNNHGENFVFITHKIKSKKESQFKKINKKHEQIGYLTPELNSKRYKLYQLLMVELKKKSPEEYEDVYNSL